MRQHQRTTTRDWHNHVYWMMDNPELVAYFVHLHHYMREHCTDDNQYGTSMLLALYEWEKDHPMRDAA